MLWLDLKKLKIYLLDAFVSVLNLVTLFILVCAYSRNGTVSSITLNDL
jgi:hypothetical protein